MISFFLQSEKVLTVKLAPSSRLHSAVDSILKPFINIKLYARFFITFFHDESSIHEVEATEMEIIYIRVSLKVE